VYNKVLRSEEHRTVHTRDLRLQPECDSATFLASVGPLYFLTLRKIQIVWVRLDAEPLQLNFLVDEYQTIGRDGRVPRSRLGHIHAGLDPPAPHRFRHIAVHPRRQLSRYDFN